MAVKSCPFACVLFVASSAARAGEAGPDAAGVQQHLDLIWMLVAAAMVFFMQAGFTALETGMVRAKNSINVAVKNVADMIATVLMFYLIGYALMFGASSGGFVGSDGFLLEGHDNPKDYAFFIFQAVFAGTAATIVSGAVAERVKFKAYIFASLVVAGLIYPVVGHWIWGGNGWLAERKFVDFAGSTVVHSTGAWVGLVAAMLLGPRIGRFNADGSVNDLQGHHIGMSAIGVFILWFGWFGFNGGSALVADASVPKIVLNTMLAPAAGGVTCFVLSMLYSGDKVVEVEAVINGILAGLVGITAGCAAVTPGGAILIGIGSGLVYLGAMRLLLALRIDDPINAVPVHGFCGAFGTLAVALVAPVSELPLGGRWEQLLVQGIGVLAVFAWSAGIALLLFGLLRLSGGLRVSAEDEEHGLNITEHGAKTVWLDTMKAMYQIVQDGDFRRRVPEEIGTEAGQVALSFNALLGELEEVAGRARAIADGYIFQRVKVKGERDELGNAMAAMTNNLDGILRQIRAVAGDVLDTAARLEGDQCELADGNDELAAAIERGSQAVARLQQQLRAIGDNIAALEDCQGELQEIVAGVQRCADDTGTCVKEMDATIARLHGASRQSRQQSDAALDKSQRGGRLIDEAKQGMAEIAAHMRRTAEEMASLDRSSEEIADIVTVMDGLAFQTNLLALNAAVEAARSGESGRGFAVVASEVRNLAQRSAEHARGIGEIIKRVRAQSGRLVAASAQGERVIAEGVQRFERVGVQFNDIVLAVERSNEAMTEVDACAGAVVAAQRRIGASADGLQTLKAQLAAASAAIRAQTEALVACRQAEEEATEAMVAQVTTVNARVGAFVRIGRGVQSAMGLLQARARQLMDILAFFKEERRETPRLRSAQAQ